MTTYGRKPTITNAKFGKSFECPRSLAEKRIVQLYKPTGSEKMLISKVFLY